MAVIDFGFNAPGEKPNAGGAGGNNGEGTPPPSNPNPNEGGDPNPDNNGGDPNPNPNPNPDDNNGNNEPDNTSNEEQTLEVGQVIEFDGDQYTVAENGDLVNDKGEVFKAKADIAEWMQSLEVDEPGLDINSIREAIGIDVTDEEGKPAEFTNDAAGVKAYLDSVIDLKSNEIQQGAINKLFMDNPILKQFVDYVAVNGTPRGFGEIPDRSSVEVDKNNVEQQKAIILTAAQEFGNKSVTDSYLKYLESNGGLYDEAVAQLAALKEKDVAYRDEMARRHEAAIRAQQEETVNYYNKVRELIEGRVIGGIRIPESYTKEVDGKKVTLTPSDFYNYISRPAYTEENTGRKITALERDYNNLSDEEVMARDILDAYLMYTGGSYKDLVSMAVKEEEAKKLVLKAKQNANKTIKFIKKNADAKPNIDFGY